MLVADGIHRIEIPLGDRYVCSYVCAGDLAAVVVDSGIAGSPREAILPVLEAVSPTPRAQLVLTTHADMDHLGGNGDLRTALPTAVFACHALDRALIEDCEALIGQRYRQFELEHGIVDPEGVYDWMRENTRTAAIDLELLGGERLRLGNGLELEVLHLPGHSHGHLGLLDRNRGIAIVADAVLGSFVPAADGRPSLPPTYRYVDEYLATIETLERLELDILLTGHYSVLEGAAAVSSFLAESRSFAGSLEQELVAALGASDGIVLRDLIDVLSQRVGSWPAETREMLAFPLVGHLERLERLGLAERFRDDGVVRWRLAAGAADAQRAGRT